MKKFKIIPIILSLFLQSCFSLKLAWYEPREGENKICLTFDDGPNGIATKKLIDVLDKHKVPATFFIIGENAEKYPDLLKLISDKSYNIGNHSYRHDLLFFSYDENSIKESILKTNFIIHKITGKTPNLFRAPNGLTNSKIENITESLNMFNVGINIFTNDPMLVTEETVYKKVIQNTKEGISILVLHDGFATINNPHRIIISQALDKIIPKLKKKGYKFGYLDGSGICK